MSKSPSGKLKGTRIELADEEHRAMHILAAMHGSGGIKPEVEEAVRYWLRLHTDSSGNLSPQKHEPGKAKTGDIELLKGGSKNWGARGSKAHAEQQQPSQSKQRVRGDQ